MREIFFFRNEVEPGCPDHYTFCMVTFIVESCLIPFVGYYVGIRSVLLAHFVSDVAYPILLLPENLQGTTSPNLESQPSRQAGVSKGMPEVLLYTSGLWSPSCCLPKVHGYS